MVSIPEHPAGRPCRDRRKLLASVGYFWAEASFARNLDLHNEPRLGLAATKKSAALKNGRQNTV